MNVLELFATLGVKLKKGEFTDVFSLLDHLQGSFEKVFGAIETVVSKGFEAIAKTAEQGDALATTAEKLGITAQAVQELGFAAVASDSSVEALENGLKFLAKNASEAALKGGEAAASFKGIKLKDKGQLRSVDDLLADIADRFSTTTDASEKTRLAMDIFGRAGADLIPLLNRGAAGVAALRAEFKASGAELDTSTIKAAEDYDDQLKRLNVSVDGLRVRFAGPLIPKVTKLFERLSKIFKSAGVARALDGLSAGFDRMLRVVGLIVDSFAWFAESEDRVSVALFALTSVVAALTLGGAAMAGSMLAAAAATIGAWVAAAAPFLLLGGLIALIVDEILTFVEGGDSMLGRLIKWLNDATSTGSTFFDLLKSAGSLLFDLTDPEKWNRLGRSIQAFLIEPFQKFVGGVRWVLQKLGLISDANASSENDRYQADFPGLQDPLSLQGRTIDEAFKAKFPGSSDPLALKGRSFGDAFAEKFPGFGLKPSQVFSASANAPGPAAASNNTNANVSVSAPVNVSVASGDPEMIASSVSKAVDQKWRAVINEANAGVTN